MAYNIILENSGGELDRWTVDEQVDLIQKVVDIVADLGEMHHGDVIKIIEVDGVAK